MIHLYIKSCRNGANERLVPEPFTSYRAAVIRGQELAGHGCFFVDTGTRSPSREEQLLITEKASAKLAKLLEL